MDEESQVIIRLKSDFYRDGFARAFFAFVLILFVILSMLVLIVGFIVTKPKPLVFATDSDWRVVAPIPVTQAYPATADLIQWVTDVIPSSFSVDFFNYSEEMKQSEKVFTADGWKKFLIQSDSYIGQKVVIDNQVFVTANPAGAPFILNQGILNGSYSWWIQMPLNLSYSGADNNATIPLILQILVVRTSTLNDLRGVQIGNIIVRKGTGDQIIAHRQ